MSICTEVYVEHFVKIDCHEYSIRYSGTGKVAVRLYDSRGEMINEMLYDSSISDVTNRIKTNKDGVYSIKIYAEVNGAIDYNVVIAEFPIYDICEANACYLKLVNSLQCCDVADCDDAGKKKAADVREALNRIGGLMYFINMYIRIETDKYLGLTNIDATRADYVAQVDSLFEKMAITLERCSTCFDDSKSDSECKSCN